MRLKGNGKYLNKHVNTEKKHRKDMIDICITLAVIKIQALASALGNSKKKKKAMKAQVFFFHRGNKRALLSVTVCRFFLKC